MALRVEVLDVVVDFERVVAVCVLAIDVGC